MSAASYPLAGVLPVFQTPFIDDVDYAIDYATLERELSWLFERGAAGVTMAMVSETLRLSSEERDQLAAFVCEKSAGHGAAVISVGAESTPLTLRHASKAEAAGATAVMAIPPVSTAVGESELLAYYEALIAAVDIPVIVQDASGYVGRPMSIDMQAELLKRHGNERVLFKPEAQPTGPMLSALRDATNGEAKVFEGSGGIGLIDSHRRGITGTMPGAEIIDAQIALWNAMQAGDDDRAYALSFPIASLVALQVGLDGFLAVEKHLLVRQGIFKNQLIRPPIGFILDEETRTEVNRLFDRLKSALDESS